MTKRKQPLRECNRVKKPRQTPTQKIPRKKKLRLLPGHKAVRKFLQNGGGFRGILGHRLMNCALRECENEPCGGVGYRQLYAVFRRKQLRYGSQDRIFVRGLWVVSQSALRIAWSSTNVRQWLLRAVGEHCIFPNELLVCYSLRAKVALQADLDINWNRKQISTEVQQSVCSLPTVLCGVIAMYTQ
jgi:hypothetical protein